MFSPTVPSTLCLPHPYLTSYRVEPSTKAKATDQYSWLRISHSAADTPSQGRPLSAPLHGDIEFTLPQDPEDNDSAPPLANNTFWARIRRSPAAVIRWDRENVNLGHLWLLIYATFTLRPDNEYYRLVMQDAKSEDLAEELKTVGLAIQHPVAADSSDEGSKELVVIRSTFWQGAGSPFGARPAWAPDTTTVKTTKRPLAAYPVLPTDYTLSTRFPKANIHAFHPRRPQKPTPGEVIYSRYIPHLGENFNVIALDYHNPEHLNLFHTWQNDPRVSAGWNETGTLEEHRHYLRTLHEDPHTLTVLARFDDNFFAYYEIYWAKEDHFGVYCDAGDFDRGRHCLVGNDRFRGAHRVSIWWSSLMHYMFLDEPRTMAAVGEPKFTNTTVISYDLMCGFGVQKFVDLPHKRSAFVRCSRERFFQICPLHYNGDRRVGGTGIELFAKAKL
ncbi:hypothetical protein AAFC00_005053 [Neodothiora populina]|uniref:Acyltransferase MbtK/IucB-like conserved domain-containing protein n=1 Tax=Neodothiora populina TaxID=2781224 RepID=A0ABR3PKQ9_9PEZI